MAGILAYSSNTDLALELLAAAKIIEQETTVLCMNDDEQAHALAGAGAKVCKIANYDITIYDTDAVAEAIVQASGQVSANIILLSSDRRGKELAGRVAQKLSAGCLTDVKSIKLNGVQIECQRNALGGATIATQVLVSEMKVFAISPKSYKMVEKKKDGSISALSTTGIKSRIRLVERIKKNKDSVDIGDADILLVAGCGVEDDSSLHVIESIAACLGGVVACSKPIATDRKWYPEDRIIGLSGKICKPKLALTLGVSGQVQFTVGIRDAGLLVSINNDENAPMSKIADYFLVADLKELLPQLETTLKGI